MTNDNSIPQNNDLDLSRRYWLFLYAFNDPMGGMADIYRTYNTLEEAQSLENTHANFANEGQILDIETRSVVSVLSTGDYETGYWRKWESHEGKWKRYE